MVGDKDDEDIVIGATTKVENLVVAMQLNVRFTARVEAREPLPIYTFISPQPTLTFPRLCICTSLCIHTLSYSLFYHHHALLLLANYDNSTNHNNNR